MKYAVIYDSVTGNTKTLAEKAAEVITEFLGQDCPLYTMQPEEQAKAAQADIIFIGFYTKIGSCSDAMKEFLSTIAGKKVFLFGTAGFGGSQEYYGGILNNVKALLPSDCYLLGSFMCQGKMPAQVRERYAQAALQNPSDIRSKEMLYNYDKALAHPNSDDCENLAKALRKTLS